MIKYPQMSQRMTKPTKWHVHPTETQISLGIRPVWSVFAVHMKKVWVLSYQLSAQQRLWSDWVDAQADLSLRWAHMPFCRFCPVLAQMLFSWRFYGKLSTAKPWSRNKHSCGTVIFLFLYSFNMAKKNSARHGWRDQKKGLAEEKTTKDDWS